MTKHVKIVLSGSRDIPFDKLVLSQANVRRVKAGVSIDTLAEDIARRGLLQSLTVRAERDEAGADTGRFEVPAGGRRYRALEKLVKGRRMAKTEPVPCVVRDDDKISAEEDSLAENVHREALHPLDQFRAMQALVVQGLDVETVAATFMVTPAVVKQRLKLASVSPALHEVYAEDGMTLEQLMAFSVTEDHERQEQVWAMLETGYNRQPYIIRQKLTEDAVRATDRRVLFVSLEAYIAAGGYVLRDLFEDDHGGWLQDIALLDRLVDEKLQAEAARIGEEGWKWVAVAVDLAYGYDADMRELVGTKADLTAEDESRLKTLRTEADMLENEWSGAEEVPDEIDARVTAIDEEIAAITTRPPIYDPAEMTIAGAFVSLDHDGTLYVERGFVRPEDELVSPERSESELNDCDRIADDEAREQGEHLPAIVSFGGAPSAASPADTEDEQDDMLRPLADRLVTELTTHRTLALRDAVARHPKVAFAAVLYAFVLDTFYHYASVESCLQVSVRQPNLSVHAPGFASCASAEAIDVRHDQWKERLPDDPSSLWESLIALDADDQAALFAHCASFGINAVWEPANRYNDGRVSARTVAARIDHSHVVARASDLDMVAAGWLPTSESYLGRVTKLRILQAVDEAKGAQAADRISGLKKPEMVKAAEDLLAGSSWLAEPLRTPVPAPVAESAAPADESAIDAGSIDADHEDEAFEPMAIAAE